MAAARPMQSGVLLVDKPEGLTSHDVVARVRRIFGQREVGHTGTLDPMATGLLVLTLGRATRIGRFIEATDKAYEGIVTLGRSTTTWDAEGETVAIAEVARLDREALHVACQGLIGEIDQPVPPYSAVKVEGERLYVRARRGETSTTVRRSVTVRALEVTGVDLPHVALRAVVSKGTYIRSLAVQLGEALGVPAHLSRLRRMAVGDRRVADARTLDSLSGTQEELIPMREALPHLAVVLVEDDGLAEVVHGRPLRAKHLFSGAGGAGFLAGDALVVVSRGGELVAVATALVDATARASIPAEQPCVRYACVLKPPDGDSPTTTEGASLD